MIGDETNSYAYQNSVRYFQIASLKQQAYAILFSYRVQNYSKLSNCANLETSMKGFLKFFRTDNRLNINDITTNQSLSQTCEAHQSKQHVSRLKTKENHPLYTKKGCIEPMFNASHYI